MAPEYYYNFTFRLSPARETRTADVMCSRHDEFPQLGQVEMILRFPCASIASLIAPHSHREAGDEQKKPSAAECVNVIENRKSSARGAAAQIKNDTISVITIIAGFVIFDGKKSPARSASDVLRSRVRAAE